MIENKSSLSDYAIRQFLLAQLPSSQQSLFELSLFTNEQFEQRVRLSELAVVHDYVCGRLTKPERTLFENNFLITEARADLLTVSRALRQRFAGVTTGRSLAETQLFTGIRTHWRIAFAALLILVLLGTAWIGIRKEPQIKEAIIRQFVRKPLQPETRPTDSHHSTNTSNPQHTRESGPLPEHARVNPQFVTPKPDRANAPSIVLSASKDAVVRLELPLRFDPSDEYDAELLTAQGEPVFTAKADGSAVVSLQVDVPAVLLKPGEYNVRVVNARLKQTEMTYYFRVQ
jgi:hypothetical protein